MNENNYLVIMAGGVGTRFWPMSRNSKPKQFLDVLGTGKTLIQQTVERFEGLIPEQNIYVVTSVEYVNTVNEQLPFIHKEQILSEPSRCNTAPCIAYACYKISALNPNATVIISPADHVVLKEVDFKNRIVECIAEAQNDKLVTLGIQPSRPDTGYGYIKFEKSDITAKKVLQFMEKPNLTLAQEFIDSGNYVWNAGIFIWQLNTFKNTFESLMPEMSASFKAGMGYYFTESEQAFIDNLYLNCQNISIDYALMEKASNVSTILADVGWSDLGTWRSLHEVAAKNNHNNSIQGNVAVFDTQNSIIKAPENMFLVAQGLDGYIVVNHQNALLICKIEEEQRVKEFVELAKQKGQDYI